MAYDHKNVWHKGPAKAMFDHHSTKLEQIRFHALTRKALILQTYVYLRDADAKDFYDVSMSACLWTRFADMVETNEDNSGVGDGVGGGGKTKPRCGHCRSTLCHELARVGLSKTSCSLREVTDSPKARAIAKQAVALFAEHPTGPFLDVMAGVRGRMSKHEGTWIQLSSRVKQSYFKRKQSPS